MLKLHHFLTIAVFSNFLSVCPATELNKTKIDLFPQKYNQSLLKDYSAKELRIIEKDLKILEELSFDQKSPQLNQPPIYIATVGGPGSSKSTILESFLEEHPDFVYVDPDQVSLRNMIFTANKWSSLFQMSQHENIIAVKKLAYEKWRWTSNYIANVILNKAFNEHYSIAHGTTSTSPKVADLYKKLKEAGYRITLMVCISPDDNRLKALNYRINEQKIYQSTPEDNIAKAKMVFQRFPVYFEYADDIQFLWIEHFNQKPQLAAEYKKGHKIKITNQVAFDKIKNMYESQRTSNTEHSNLPPFNSLMDSGSAD